MPLHEISSCPESFVEKTILSPLNGLGILVENQWIVDVRVCFCTLSLVPLIHMSVFMPV